MKKMNWLWLVAFGLLTLLNSCGTEEEKIPDVSAISVELEITRLEDELFAIKSVEDGEAFLKKHPQLAQEYFFVGNYPEPKVLAKTLYDFVQVKENDTLYQDTKAIFADFSEQRKQLEKAFQFVKYYFPQVQIPKIYTVISGFASFGFGQDVFVGRDYLVIGLDYFAGPESTYRPSLPNYIVSRLTPEHLVPTVMKLYSSGFNAYDPQDQQMLADIIFYGKALYFTDKVCPFLPDSLIIGYDTQGMADSEKNEAHIWKFFIDRNLLFTSENFIKTKFLGESPRILEIGETCPGRIGRYVGWQIIKSYALSHPEEDLFAIMQEKSASKLFQQSRYRPE